ncbi:NAD(P)/FAD-dependent oxidoreductase [Nocardia sp. NPDC088792]|uniref:NAD(P)/FAD-dependent oxidoreductase n=1 Tax=Nocardia sp. NPDC088792 TaxID=3364332 RepID=UPI00382D63CA
MTGRIVIVGTGVAGATAAKTLRTEGYSGEILLLGAEPSLPYRRPMVSKELLAGTAAERRTLLQPAEFWRDHAIDLRTATTVERIDPVPQLVWPADGTAIGYDSLLLATGALPRRLPGATAASKGLEGPGVHTLRLRSDVGGVRSVLSAGGSLVIVGGGLIGCEVAATARGLGARVTILHAGATLLDRVAPAVVGEYYRKLHADNGVEVVTGVMLDRLEDGEGVTAVAADGRRWVASAALVAIGAVPDTRLAERAGLAIEEGIRVDERYRTSAAGIFAAGDAASRLDSESGEYRREEHWNSAQAQGAAAARSMLGLPAVPEEISWGWSQQYGRNLQFAGMIRPEHEVIVRGDAAAGDVTVLGLDGGRLVGAVGVGRPAEIRAARDLIARRVVLDSAECADPARPLGAVTALSGQS